MRTLLVPVDGSRFAERALTLAVPLALQHGATIVLTMAHPVPRREHDAMGAPDSDDAHPDSVRAHLRAQLERVARRVTTRHRITTATQFREGPVVDEIEHAARESNADLMIMATHGRTGVSRLWLGSVTDAMLRRSPVPVLVTRSERKWTLTSASEPIFPRIMVALDGSPHSERALADTLRVIGAYTCHVVLVRVEDAPIASVSSTWVTEVTKEITDSYLAPLAEQHAKPTLKFTTRVVVHSDPARALLEVAKEERAFLISVATHGRTGVRRAVLGSVADKVIRGATVPVLVSPAS